MIIERIKKLLSAIFNKTNIVVLIVVTTSVASIICGFAYLQYTTNENNKKAVLERLEEDQREKAKEIANQQAKPADNTDISNLQFTDISSSDYKKPTCDRLDGRSGIIIQDNSCRYKIRAHGQLKMAVIFIYENSDGSTGDLSNQDASNTNSLEYINTYIKREATRYGVDDPPNINIKYFGPFKTSASVSSLYYREDGYKILEIFNQTSASNNVPEDQYDMVHFVLLDNQYGGVAFPFMHRAVSYNDTIIGTFIHETLHLLGASDKYYDNDCNTIGTNDPFGRYNDTLPGNDIMCSVSWPLDVTKINDITAREIGWSN